MQPRHILSILVGIGWVLSVVGSPWAGQGPQDTLLLVVRHGEAYSNLPHPPAAPPASLDTLTPRGVAEATAAAVVAKRYHVAAVVASPTGRTRETAAIIAREVNLEGSPAEDGALASVHMGTLPNGQMSTWEWRFAEWQAGHDPRPAGGESLEDATARAVRVVQGLVARYAGQTIVVVTHSDIVAALLGYAVGTPVNQCYETHKVAPGSVSAITITEDGAWQFGRW